MCLRVVHILLDRLCIAYTEINMYNKIFNPLPLFVGVGDCRGQCQGIAPVSPPPMNL